MRDQDLMKRAQHAAAELERAWYRWRSGQGPQSEPVLTVTSYVGYSVNDPVGQPRVVFGITASDAELLADLLARRAPVPLPVPPQAPPLLAEQSGFRAEAKGRLPETAAGRITATQPESARAETRADLRAETRADPRPETRADPRPETRADPRAETRAEPRAETGGAPPAGDGGGVAHAAAAPGETADQRPARLLPSPAVPLGTGPWALAASAARLEAETRIRAAARLTPVEAEAEAEVEAETRSEPKGRPEVAAGARTRYSVDRPADGDPTEATSEDQAQLALAWGGPAFGRAHEDGTALVQLRPKREPAFADTAAEADSVVGFADDRPMLPAAAAEGRRGRAARGYPVQRMQRVRRQSALPGA